MNNAKMTTKVLLLHTRFLETIERHFPGRTEWHWYRALGAVNGENCARNDDTSDDAALAADAGIEHAYGAYLAALASFYRDRDGENGFLGSRGL